MLCKPQILFLRERILSILGLEPPSVFYIGTIGLIKAVNTFNSG